MKNFGMHLAVACIATLAILTPAQSKTDLNKRPCKSDYKRLCPDMPISTCDLKKMIDKLSPACRKFVETQ